MIDAAIKSVQDLQDAFACLEWLRALRVIHRDLSPRHFLRHRGRLFLIDFGFALLLRVDARPEPGVGGGEFQRLVLLRTQQRPAGAGSESHRCSTGPPSRTTWRAWSSCASQTATAGEKERLKLRDRRAYTSIRDFWHDCEQRMDGQVFGQRWAEALKHARDNKLEETREALLPLFHHR